MLIPLKAISTPHSVFYEFTVNLWYYAPGFLDETLFELVRVEWARFAISSIGWVLAYIIFRINYIRSKRVRTIQEISSCTDDLLDNLFVCLFNVPSRKTKGKTKYYENEKARETVLRKLIYLENHIQLFHLMVWDRELKTYLDLQPIQVKKLIEIGCNLEALDIRKTVHAPHAEKSEAYQSVTEALNDVILKLEATVSLAKH
ncbi:Uncharacterised protein [BD1-7 clade bacterium]|uniref:Uncharacterized protein n=1 Tax=BD1-7 clade bacterium TaxID=2029982 RepID=A0A5S9Q3X0_9GAMM|nr:Uncharacterised protein [BD1-7 clade bacterium]CAA0111771.1 Uncharacterised protein [BD1-7 clade bacterium]